MIDTGSLGLPAIILPHETICTANLHVLPSVGTSVQVTVVVVVVVGQLPQLDDRMLYRVGGQSDIVEFPLVDQLNVSSFAPTSTCLM